MLYIILPDNDMDSVLAPLIESYVREKFPSLRSEWYWHDIDSYSPVEYGVKVDIEPNHPEWNLVVLTVARYCLCRGGRITFEVPE